jgi:hypothetical protein
MRSLEDEKAALPVKCSTQLIRSAGIMALFEGHHNYQAKSLMVFRLLTGLLYLREYVV